MAKTLGYMITWTTYGTWLQGDERGYVKNAAILRGNHLLWKSNEQKLKKETVSLTQIQRSFVLEAINQEIKAKGQEIYAIAVCSNHVHLVAGYINIPIEKLVWAYKFASARALHKEGFKGKVWTKGYDKRFCFDKKTLKQRVEYVKRHNI